ncbi:MAG: serine/threonine protein kinase [Candidatus Dormibacteraeota bacterium]|nr:serine/threonine protein kinase [Candidatus Dormibacteraeota bacterium]
MAPVRQVGEWLLGDRIGQGGNGSVYLAHSTRTGSPAAVKEFLVTRPEAGLTEQFRHEARLLSKLIHPNIVGLIDVIDGDAGGYLVLEYVPGETLRDRLVRARLSTDEGLLVLEGLLRALEYAHRRSVVHLDVKPENVLMAATGEIKITDFGIARWSRRATSVPTDTTLGTPQYISPEQATGAGVDARSDIYSAGVVAYEIFCGRPPFPIGKGGDPAAVAARHVQVEPEPPRSLRPDIDEELADLILKALAKAPANRHQSAGEFLLRLEPIRSRLAPGQLGLLSGRRGGSHPPEGWLAKLLAAAQGG